MSVLVVGLSHRSAPVRLLEQMALTPDRVEKLLTDAVASPCVEEAVVLATCNRAEIYAVVDRFHPGVARLSDLLAQYGGLDRDLVSSHVYVHYEERAVHHLFSVSAGLDSMVVGEGQVLGQVRTALQLAQGVGSAGRVLNDLVQQALHVGKRAHHETGIDHVGHSLVTAALDLGEQRVGPLAGRPALVVGAGSMSALAVATLARRGIGPIVVANRTRSRAEALAMSVGGRAAGWDDLGEELAGADVVLAATGASGQVIEASTLAVAAARRGGRRQLVVDLALPRDVEAQAAQVAGVELVDLESVGASLDGQAGALDVAMVRAIVASELESYLAAERAAAVAPTVVALRARADALVDAELARLMTRLPGLADRDRAEVVQAMRRVADKLLHAPTVRVKELAGQPGAGSYAEALRALFDLDPTTTQAVSQPGQP
ncbi:MAG: glutamyl-tRNA reductase [Actinomycetes bacterium]